MEILGISMAGVGSGSLTGILAALAVLYGVGCAVYNLYFHPLAKFPGPASRAAFYFVDFWYVYRGTAHKQLKRLHDKYGDVVRVRPNLLTFSSEQAWKDIYSSRPGLGQMLKDPQFYTIPGEEHKTSIISAGNADHSRIRRLLAHCFSEAALREQEPILTQYFDLMVSELSKRCVAGQDVDMTEWYNFLTFDVIGDLCFGESFHALENGEYHYWMKNVFLGIKALRVLQIIGAYGASSLVTVMIGLIPSLAKAKEEHELFSQLKTRQRLEMKTDRKDFMTYILRHNDHRGMRQDEIENTINNLIVAGSETTATLLSGTTYHMLTNPHVYERAKAEVRSAFAHPEDMTLTSTARLPYLHALLEEGLRVYPPVAFALPRVTGKDGDHIAGHWVPPNTTVGVPQWTINKSATHWARPEVFAPERWLDSRPKEYEDDTRTAMNAFSLGPRGCIGKNLAYNEMRSVMARMLWHFDMELCAESENWTHQQSYILWEKPALRVRLSPAQRKQRA